MHSARQPVPYWLRSQPAREENQEEANAANAANATDAAHQNDRSGSNVEEDDDDEEEGSGGELDFSRTEICRTRFTRARDSARMYVVHRALQADGGGPGPADANVIASVVLKGERADRYDVVITQKGGTCTCMDFQNRQIPCKHMYWVLLRELRVPWTDQPHTTWAALLASRRQHQPRAQPQSLAAAAAATQGQVRVQGQGAAQGQDDGAIAATLQALQRICAEFPQWVPPRVIQDDGAVAECMICLDPLLPLPHAGDRIHWCRFTCGNAVHESCGRHLLEPKCPACRDNRFYTNPRRYNK